MNCDSPKPDRTSRGRLTDAMFRLLEVKNFSSITISELCREADVSRQTFYTLFESKESVVAFSLTQRCGYHPDAGETPCGTLRQMCADYGAYLRSHAALIRTLVENDIIYLLYDGFYESLMTCDCFLAGMTPEVRAYAADFMAGGFTSIARTYTRAGAQTDGALLDDLIYSLFNGSLFLDWGRLC